MGIKNVPLALACASLVATLAVAPSAMASAQNEMKAGDQLVVNSEGFLSAHPDLRWRKEAMEVYDRGQHATAAKLFQRAARFADKPSQAMYAAMLWSGEGVPQDRPLAMAWMDLAAERGYPHFVAYREKYWNALTPAERELAIERGQAVYAEYGDAVAQERLENKLRRARRHVTGSRVGYVGGMQIHLGDELVVSGDEYYQDRFWKPAAYWAWQDRTWGNPPEGKTRVGELEVLDGEDGKPAPSR